MCAPGARWRDRSIIARMRLLNPARTTIAMWTMKKSSRNPETKKCSVRADCRPPSTLTAAGNAESKAGDSARPVQITRGNRTKITVRYAARCSTLYETASASSGRREAKMLRDHFPECPPRPVGRGRKQVVPEVAGPQTCDGVDQAGQHHGPCRLKVEIPAPAILVGQHVAVASGDRRPRRRDRYFEQRRGPRIAGFAPIETAGERSGSQLR